MRPYLALVRATALMVLTYRMNFVLSLFGLIFQLLALLAIWRSVIGDGQVDGLTWPQMKTYLLVAFATGVLVSLYSDFRMAGRIQSGMVSVDLVRPVDYQTARFAETVGGVWAEALTVAVVWAVAVVVSGPMAVGGPAQVVLSLVSLVAVVPLKFLVVYLAGLTCFWTQNYLGVNWMRIAVVNLLSGALVPLSFFPDWLHLAAEYSPFAGMASTPALIMIGELNGTAAVRSVVFQLAWIAVLWFGARAAWRSAVRQLTVHGG